ncbi:MAG: hypothetical protein HY657_13080 [Acidobacteria bacterium]|nr:hypothetical protein [Acidobacteriota bacterium]
MRARARYAVSAYATAVDGVRDGLTTVERFVALEGSRPGWMEYETTPAAASPAFAPVEIGERDP